MRTTPQKNDNDAMSHHPFFMHDMSYSFFFTDNVDNKYYYHPVDA
jgi:hypothetical protein